MTTFFTEAAALIIEVVFGLYILAVLLRFLFQIVRADFYNPISQFLVALTNPLLKPLRRVIPGMYGIDVASLVLLVALKGLEVFLIFSLGGYALEPLPVIIAAAVDLLRLTINIFGPLPLEFNVAFPVATGDGDDEQIFSFVVGRIFGS